jgi:hypothetical protein
MDIELIRQRANESVEPFILRLSDGRSIDEPHPDFIAFGKRVVFIVGSNELPRSFDPLHIESLEEPAPKRKER